ncbi:MAG: TonB-dependent receptor plug domain-containing protein [Proteobacteria bacterium]|nr:TonB-dependent receptor plug domain-containing protein [Pseudomonadota bacterium]
MPAPCAKRQLPGKSRPDGHWAGTSSSFSIGLDHRRVNVRKNNRLAVAVTTVLSTCAAAAGAAESAGGIEEIVVTAQRRSESVQNVPITIQAVTGDQLGQLAVTTFDDVLKLLPNVTFSSNGPGQGNIYMRGLSAGFAGNQSSAAISPFPNVATYLDDQSMTFPSRNADVYMVDMERVEVLEGPQGTLFGGGAEAGAIRYITNKPKINKTEGYAELSYGTTAHGDPNTAVNGTINLPLIQDHLAVRATIYNDRRGGYIDNVPSKFTRKPTDLGPAAYGSSYPTDPATGIITAPGADNYALAGRAQNPTTYNGMRLSALYQINDNWDVLIQQSYQNLDAEGMAAQFPVGSDGQALGPWEETSFSPTYDKDHYTSTAWTLNGQFRDFKFVYTGSYMSRHIDNAMDYTNYARTAGGFYYTCTGGPASGSNIGAGGPSTCYSPVSSWHDIVETTHQSHEIRLTTPENLPLRGLFGAFWEDFQIKDDMNFLYRSIPSCTADNLALAEANGTVCVTNAIPINAAVDPSMRNDSVAFGEDLRRGYKQTAFFTSIDYDIIPKVLTITGGTRYFRYTEDEVGSQYGTPGCTNTLNGTGVVFNPATGRNGCGGSTAIGGGLDVDPITGQQTDFHRATFTGFRSRGNLTWHITPDAMVYYTFSQGYRPGAFNRTTKGVTKVAIDPATGQAVPNGVTPPTGYTKANQYLKPFSYPPDSLTNNEVGFKTQWLDRRLQINGSIYQMDWKNVQTLIYNPPVYGNTTFGVEGPTYRVKGFELQGIARITDGFTLQGSLSYNDSKQTDSPCIRSAGVTSKTPGNPTPAGDCITQVWDSAAGTNVAVQNALGADGSVPAFSPKLQYNLRARYDWMVNDYKAFIMVGGTHVDKMDNEPSSFQSGAGVAIPTTTWLRYTMPAYELYDASVGVAKDAWTLEAYGTNLANKNTSLFTSSAQFVLSEVPTRPRVLGVKFGFKF